MHARSNHVYSLSFLDTEAAVGLCGLVVVGVVVVILLVHTEVLCLQTSLPQLLVGILIILFLALFSFCVTNRLTGTDGLKGVVDL